ncbi:nitrile hydratase subunit beta [Microbacterium oleivorans]|uniref:Nitrile hydratase subunit beta n=1 Tax=Microbacterium oleivorans TaxID=273677 RepID=A0A7D5IU68_9MICO|nr:nitrile hydratase subunit beta [Microbacterium oleivorans]QLD12774.1 nitrile hydratase subunit beta [Microbacterium oleivorans]
MNGIHDVGGMDGLGPIDPEADEPVFHAEWERAAFAMFSQGFAGGYFNIDQFRYGIEQMRPVDYLTHAYYAHWMHSFEHYMTAKDIDAAELERRTQFYLENVDAPLPATVNDALESLVEVIAANGASARRAVAVAPRYAVGDVVRVLDSVPFDHTRRAAYVRGRSGTIVTVHGAFVYPDTAGNGGGEDPQHVYTVRFAAESLFGVGIGNPNDSVYVDLWEPYLLQPIAA